MRAFLGQRQYIRPPSTSTRFSYPYITSRTVVFSHPRAVVVYRRTYDVFSPRPGLPSPTQRIFRGARRERLVPTCLFEFLHDSVRLAQSYTLSPMREKCPICSKPFQTSGLSNHLRRCKGPRGVANPGAKKRLRPAQDALRVPAKIPRRENRGAESRERQENRDGVNEVRPCLGRV